MGSAHGGQRWLGGWQGSGHGCLQVPRATWHGRLHCTHGCAAGSWHPAWQLWLPQASGRPQGCSQANGAALLQGRGTVECPPTQLTGTGTAHCGQGVRWPPAVRGRLSSSRRASAAAACAGAGCCCCCCAARCLPLAPPGAGPTGATGGGGGAYAGTTGCGGSWQACSPHGCPQASVVPQPKGQGGQGPK